MIENWNNCMAIATIYKCGNRTQFKRNNILQIHEWDIEILVFLHLYPNFVQFILRLKSVLYKNYSKIT